MLREKAGRGCGDVLVVAHGHVLRAFAMRWIGRELTEGVGLILEGMFLVFHILRSFGGRMYADGIVVAYVAGGVGTLRYVHS